MSRLVGDPDVQRRLLILASLLSAAVVLMRPISIVWMVGLVAVGLIGATPRRRRDLLTRPMLAWAVAPTALALIASWAWALYARIEVKDDRLTNSLSLGGAVRQSIENWPRYFRETIGVLGWLDTKMPTFVYAAWIAAIIVLIVVHLRSATSRGVVALVALVAAWLVLPLITNGFTNSRAGLIYQGRYSLPIFVGLAFLPMWNDRAAIRWPRLSQQAMIAVVLALVVVAEAGAFWQTLRRFTVGAHGKIVLTDPLPWQPSIAPMLLIAVNAIAMVALAWSAWRPWGDTGGGGR